MTRLIVRDPISYTNNLKRFGFGPDDIAGTGSDRLISQVIPDGPEALRERVQANLDAGADHVRTTRVDYAKSLAEPFVSH
ncbi:MAG: hypothetical protein ACRDNW_09995 [Trebonia sp.]